MSSTPCDSCPPGQSCGSVTCTVARLIYCHPATFANRTQALHWILCRTGTGFEWSRGAPVDVLGHQSERTEEEATRPTGVPQPPPWLKQADPDDYQDMVKEYEAERERLRSIRAHAGELARTAGPLGFDPLKRGTFLALRHDLPDDLQPEWRAAADEIDAVVHPLQEAQSLHHKAIVEQMAEHRAELQNAIGRLRQPGREPSRTDEALAHLLGFLLRKDHDVHEHPDHPLNSGIWHCSACGDLNVMPENCPGWHAYQAARMVNGRTRDLVVTVQDGHLICPACGARDEIAEHEMTRREIGFHVAGDGSLVADPGQWFDPESEYFDCGQCGSHVVMPGDLAIVYPRSD
ncbi:hypothetical protein [Nonomuraea sp. NPDC050202]|uniref:hypothetical protein n=1 Tax=Nonomuraea sp. NPDC050202 TaxID=3155035 RepID=UPI003407E4AA